MAAVKKIDSNVTGLAYAEELTLGALPVTPVWVPLEPNSYSDFGGQLQTIARNPINSGRQRKKGVVTDLDASGGFESDFTQTNVQNLLQGFFFADFRKKGDLAPTTVTGGSKTFNVASGGGAFDANDLLFATNFAVTGNNGLKHVASSSGTTVVVTETMTNDTTGNIVRVGHQFASGDASIDMTGTWPALTTSSKDLTQLDLIPGEWIYIGGDTAVMGFATAANNGWACVRSVAAARMEFHKTENLMVTDAGTSKTIQIFTGRVLKNEVGSLIKRRTYNLERQLGAPDDASPSQIQSEYLVGAVANEFSMAINTADKITADLSFIATDNEQRTGATGVKSGTRTTLAETDALNTSTDVRRIKLSSYATGVAFATPLFAFLQQVNVSINNNCTPNKAISVLGAFEVTAGTFEVSASMDAYFASVEAVSLVRQNSDTTLDIILGKSNTAIAIDFPMLTLGDGRLSVQQDQPITLPLSCDAATGAKFQSDMNHTMLMSFFDYVPTAAA